MTIYDYYKNNSFSSTFFLIATVVCLIVLVYQVILAIKMLNNSFKKLEFLLLIFTLILTLVITLFVTFQTYCLIKFDLDFKNKNYETVTGNLNIITIERNDYRDSEGYDITFSVNEHHFDKMNTFSAGEKKNLLESNSNIVTVYYGYIKKQVVIYRIEGDTQKTGDGSVS